MIAISAINILAHTDPGIQSMMWEYYLALLIAGLAIAVIAAMWKS